MLKNALEDARKNAQDRRTWSIIAVVMVVFALFIPFSQLVLGVTFDYTLRTVAIGGSILGVVSGVIGCFAVLRHESLMGDAISHATLPGVVIAFLFLGRDLGVLLIGAAISAWIGVMVVNAITSTTRIKQDAAMGIVLATWFAAGIALLAYVQSYPNASQAGLDSFIFGQAAAIVERDVMLITVVGFICFVVLGLFWKEFKLITFDREFARANGTPVQFFSLILSTMTVIAIVLGLQLAGVILMVGMLIAPGVAARQWTHKLGQMVVLAAVFGAFAGGTGAVISAIDKDIPTGPMIIVMAFLVVALSLLFAPERGIVWRWLKQRRDRQRFMVTNVLNDVYVYANRHEGQSTVVPQDYLTGIRGKGALKALQQLQDDGHIIALHGGWQLTSTGYAQVKQEEHNQHLWEAYRRYGDDLHLPVVPEDRQQDIHKVLPDEAVTQLEAVLLEGGMD